MPLSWNEIRNRAIEFASEWADETSESAEAKTFWDQFFKVFGVSRKRIATFEKRVEKIDGGNGYIDLFWPGHLVAEHKSRGKDLDRAYGQAIDYFHGLKDEELPRYVIVSDFARFRVHDLEGDTETEFPLSELPDRINDFGFIAGYEKREFREQDPVNVKAAEKLAALHDGLLEIGYGGHDLEVYLVRILFCLFAEDTGIFNPRGAFYDFIDQRTSEDGSDLAARLNELFDVLNTPEDQRLKTRDEQVNSFPYINGGLFEERLRTAAFDANLRKLLIECCNIDWGRVSPAIFGSLFQGIMDKTKRRDLGAHYTSEQNIMKVIGPLFLDDLKAELEASKTKQKLEAFHDKLSRLNFFDPACGCGNFLVITYREIRLLELEVIRRLYGDKIKTLHLLDVIDNYVQVNVDQFHGIEIEEWPAQIARVAMWLIDHQMNEMVSVEFGNAFVRIPLVKSANIVHGDALDTDWNSVIAPQNCNFIIGNPPFIGKKGMSQAQRDQHDDIHSGIKGAGLLDYVTAWYVKALYYLKENPVIEGCFVSTNSITQGEQPGIIWKSLKESGLKINFAHKTFQWQSEAPKKAAVHCVIIGFALFDRENKYIFEYADIKGEPDCVKAKNINSYLADGPDAYLSSRRSPIDKIPNITFGSMANDGGWLLLNDDERDDLIKEDSRCEKFIKPFLGAKEFTNRTNRWCIWLDGVSPNEFRPIKPIMKRVEEVKNYRASSTRKATAELAEVPYRFGEVRQPDTEYILVPRHGSFKRIYTPMGFFSPSIICGDHNLLIPNSGLLHFGIISSLMHNSWLRSVGGRIKNDPRYSASIVYNNFPWPKISDTQKRRIEESAQAILDARDKYPDSNLADLYDPLAMPQELRKAHHENDRAVDAAYGRRKFNTEAERVGYLFELYQEKISQ